MTDASKGVLEGGCHCGALRYRITGPPVHTDYCHCRICQRTTGAPALACTSVPIEAFALTKGRPVVYKSSSWGERHFCGVCGAQILYRDSEAPKAVDINVGTLDDPAAVRPEYHIFTSSKIAWFEVADDLPRYPDAGPNKGA
jgi:hypothetical protein